MEGDKNDGSAAAYEKRCERQMGQTRHHEANPPGKSLTESETHELDKLLDWDETLENDEPR